MSPRMTRLISHPTMQLTTVKQHGICYKPSQNSPHKPEGLCIQTAEGPHI